LLIDTILVARGAEYQAVCRGLNRVAGGKPYVVAIPVGTKPLDRFLRQLPSTSGYRVLVMGLCGSLLPGYQVGEIVLYEDCIYPEASALTQPCDRSLTAQLEKKLPKKSLVRGLTSDRVIWSATEKQNLGLLGAGVVDMEGFAALEFLTQAGASVAMLRVISDDCHHNLPDLTSAFSDDGILQPLPLAIAMLKQPLAATRLIRGSLRGLKVLEQVTTLLFSA
jgi:Phosphorylase superfamily